MEDPHCLYNSDPTATVLWPEDNLQSLCRVCANPNEYLIPVFKGEGVDHQLKMKIDRYLPINVFETDSLPTQVCYQCASTIIAWHDLFENCYEAERKLYSCLNNGPKKDKCRDLSDKVLNDSLALLSTEEPNLIPEKEPAIETPKVLQPVKKRGWESLEKTDDEKSTEKKESFLTEISRVENRCSRFSDFHQAQFACRHYLVGYSKEEINHLLCSTSLHCTPLKPFKESCERNIITSSELPCDLTCQNQFSSVKEENSDYLSSSSSLVSNRLLENGESSDGRKPEITLSSCSKENTLLSSPKIENSSLDKIIVKQSLSRFPSVGNDKKLVSKPQNEASQCNVAGSSLYDCKLCQKTIKTKRGFLRHMLAHSGEKPYTCHKCGKQYMSSHDLNRHIKCVHDGIKNYNCDICGRSFANKGTRNDHRRIHTGEKPYTCDICGKSFPTPSSIYVHRRIHSDYYPHECSFCDKKFRRKQLLIHHIRRHTGEKPYSCEICSKSFSVKEEVRRHNLTHSSDKPHVCLHCGLSFAQKRYLKNHMKVHLATTTS